LNLEHDDRQIFIDEISAINRKMDGQPAPSRGVSIEQWVK
jgi:hypothetical protein